MSTNPTTRFCGWARQGPGTPWAILVLSADSASEAAERLRLFTEGSRFSETRVLPKGQDPNTDPPR